MRKEEQDREIMAAIKALRLVLGDSQQAFAYRLEKAISTIVRYESRRAPQHGALLLRLYELAIEVGRPDLADTFHRATPLVDIPDHVLLKEARRRGLL